MKVFRLNSIICLSILGLFGCTASNTVAPGELDTTEAGLATGAVLGAGLGALVGSTAGEAGAGLVVGTVAGATSGGLIGRAIEGQERRINEHDDRSGVDTQAVVDEQRGRLGDKIWNPSGKFQSENDFNRPSGDRGLASKYYSSSTIKPDVPVSQINNFRSTSSPAARFPSIESTEKDIMGSSGSIPSSLPSARSVGVFQQNDTVHAAGKINAQPYARELPKGNSALGYGVKEVKPAIAVPVRIPSANGKNELDYSSGINTAKRNSIDHNKANMPSARARISAADSGVQAKKDIAIKQVLPIRESVTPTVKKTERTGIITAPVSGAVAGKAVTVKSKSTDSGPQVCPKGASEYQRAENAVSDSDKVFYLRRTILSCPKSPGLRVKLGKVYGKLGLKEDARKEFNAALEIDPTNDSAQDELSIMMLEE